MSRDGIDLGSGPAPDEVDVSPPEPECYSAATSIGLGPCKAYVLMRERAERAEDCAQETADIMRRQRDRLENERDALRAEVERLKGLCAAWYAFWHQGEDSGWTYEDLTRETLDDE